MTCVGASLEHDHPNCAPLSLDHRRSWSDDVQPQLENVTERVAIEVPDGGMLLHVAKLVERNGPSSMAICDSAVVCWHTAIYLVHPKL